MLTGGSGFAAFDKEIAQTRPAGRMVGILYDRQFVDSAGLWNLSRSEEEVAKIIQSAHMRGFVVKHVDIDLTGLLGSSGLFKKAGSLKEKCGGVGFELQLLFYRQQG